jgi:hypothetical protein
MDQYYQTGAPFEVPEYNETDSQESAEAEQRSMELEQRQGEIMEVVFGRDYQVDNYDPALLEAPSAPTISPGRGRAQFLENAQDLKCEIGKQPVYPPKTIPFSYYSIKPSSVCGHNPPNLFLTWNNQKYKYCCNSQPDSNEKFLKHCKDIIFSMVSNTSIDYKSTSNLTYAVKKYLHYFNQSHSPAETAEENKKMSDLIRLFTVGLTSTGEPKSDRMERTERLTKHAANSMPDWMGGMRRKSLRRKQLKQKKSKINRRRSCKK